MEQHIRRYGTEEHYGDYPVQREERSVHPPQVCGGNQTVLVQEEHSYEYHANERDCAKMEERYKPDQQSEHQQVHDARK
jgi:hypothetical protein